MQLMRAAFLAVFLAMVASQARAVTTCPNEGACKGMLQVQVLAAFPLWTGTLVAACDELYFADYPHCAQLAWPPTEGVPVVTYGETDIEAPDGAWLNAAYAPPHRPYVTPNAVLGALQYQITPLMATRLNEFGDTRGGVGPGCYFEFKVCFQEPGGANRILRIYRRTVSGDIDFNSDGWEAGDVSECAP